MTGSRDTTPVRVSGMRVVTEIPEGWRLSLFGNHAVACHPDQPPRHSYISDELPFDQWKILEQR